MRVVKEMDRALDEGRDRDWCLLLVAWVEECAYAAEPESRAARRALVALSLGRDRRRCKARLPVLCS